jgi:hypothetical protein
MQPKKTAQEIITSFELQVSDVTELSSSEELSLLNRIYQKICADRAWEFLKKNQIGSLLGSGSGGFYITVPDDFAFFYENNTYTENNASINNNTSPKVIFIGTNFTPYQIINYGDRMKYRNQNGYCYLDIGAGKIYFTGTPLETTYSMDYIKVPPQLTLTDYPIFNGKFHDLIVFGMSTNSDIINISPKATSYQKENENLYNQYLLDMQWFYSQMIQI